MQYALGKANKDIWGFHQVPGQPWTKKYYQPLLWVTIESFTIYISSNMIWLRTIAWPILPTDWVSRKTCWNHKISNITIGVQKDFEPMARETYFSKHGGKQKMDCYIYCCYLCMFFDELTYRKGLFPWCIGSKINQSLLVSLTDY